ncbi:hypothetical protein SRABI76_02800 [Microbacterium oxydans]|uniref:DUF1648 domain-containing protein n=1 Tax=Microbacterium oxydans TaxID=82380 RepID=A0A0F0LAF4_9MICO|nr:DUF1648 domain-containing protein [Microbacterium oxydans]KJL28556.1 hypothetical protein RS83_03631 [Microbacterium oxydans]CAH0232920.1 hypothetical protein SRABI76_02800 [Microbacterium oxydans]
MNADVRRARRAFWWVGVIVPFAMIILSSLVIAAWMPEIPDPSAIHWGTDGVDGFGPRWTNLAVLIGFGGGMVTLFTLIALFAHRMPDAGGDRLPSRPQWSATARFLGASNMGIAALLSTVALAAVGAQRGLANAADTPDIGFWVFVGLVAMVGLGVAAWALQPAVVVAGDESAAEAAPMPLAAEERAVWIRTVSIARSGLIVLGVAVFLSIATAVVLLARDVGAGWFTLAVAVFLVLVTATTLTFRVRASASGLLVRSAVGWPRIEIRAADIAHVRAVHVDPFAEFGGWGYRIATDGRRGVVLRGGSAIEVTRTNGRRFVVTVDDAETGAAVLATAAEKKG